MPTSDLEDEDWDLEMFGSKTIESWWLRYHIRHLQWRYTHGFLYEVMTWYRHDPPCTTYILGIRKPVDCQLHQTKTEVSCRVHFSCNKLFPGISVKVPIEFSFVCFTRSQAESIKKELSSFKIPSASLPWRDCLAPLRNVPKWNVWQMAWWNLCHRSSYMLLPSSLHCNVTRLYDVCLFVVSF